jgi:hypothetical protein
MQQATVDVTLRSPDFSVSRKLPCFKLCAISSDGRIAGRYQKVTPSRVHTMSAIARKHSVFGQHSLRSGEEDKAFCDIGCSSARRPLWVASGMGRPCDVAFPSESDRPADISAGPKSAARNRLMRYSKQRYSITSSAHLSRRSHPHPISSMVTKICHHAAVV